MQSCAGGAGKSLLFIFSQSSSSSHQCWTFIDIVGQVKMVQEMARVAANVLVNLFG
jgi:hypothetical protein